MRLLFLNNPQPNQQEKQYIYNVNQHINRQKPLVIYFYREGCPYCTETSKEWMNVRQHIRQKNNDLLFVKANCELYNMMQNVGEKPITYPAIRFVHKDRVIPFTKEGPDRNANTIANWIESMNDQPSEPDSMEVNLSASSPTISEESADQNQYQNQNQNQNIFEEEEDVFSSNKYPPFSNQFITNTPPSTKSLSPFSENIQMNISPLKSFKKRKRLYRSTRRSKKTNRNKKRRKSLYKSRTYKPRFLTTRRNHLQGRTQMF